MWVGVLKLVENGPADGAERGRLPGPRRRSVLAARLRPLDDPAQESIVAELRRVILSGEVPPGTAIPVADVAARFGVSPIPVREALKSLIAEQLVDHRRHSVYTVARLSHAELGELYLVRGVLEAAALAYALPNASTADDAAAVIALTALDDAHRRHDHRAYHRESRRFHFALLAPCRMERLMSMLAAAWNLTEPYQPMSLIDDADRDRLHAEHHRMVAAFVARDASVLTMLAAEHQHDLERSIRSLTAADQLFAPRAPAVGPGGDAAAAPTSVIPR